MLAGCTGKRHHLPDTFDAEEVAFLHKTGTATIQGQAFLKRDDGIVIYAAGEDVYLIPSGGYAQTRLDLIYRGRNRSHFRGSIEPDSPGYLKNMKVTIADSQGRFTFPRLSAGTYHLITTVVWEVDEISQGGPIHYKVSVNSGETKIVIMNGR